MIAKAAGGDESAPAQIKSRRSRPASVHDVAAQEDRQQVEGKDERDDGRLQTSRQAQARGARASASSPTIVGTVAVAARICCRCSSAPLAGQREPDNGLCPVNGGLERGRRAIRRALLQQA